MANDLKACGSGILDGELCAIDAAGKPDFAALLVALSAGRTDELIYYAFDAPWSGDQDLRRRSLLDRKVALADMIARASSRIAFSHHHDSDGPALLKAACQNGLEGIVSKRANSTYRSGRGDGWVKSKCRLGMDVNYATKRGQ